MRRVLFIAGMGVFCAILASWAALAWAQPTAGKLPEAAAPQPQPLPALPAPPAPLPGPGLSVADPEPAAAGPLAPPRWSDPKRRQIPRLPRRLFLRPARSHPSRLRPRPLRPIR